MQSHSIYPDCVFFFFHQEHSLLADGDDNVKKKRRHMFGVTDEDLLQNSCSGSDALIHLQQQHRLSEPTFGKTHTQQTFFCKVLKPCPG